MKISKQLLEKIIKEETIKALEEAVRKRRMPSPVAAGIAALGLSVGGAAKMGSDIEDKKNKITMVQQGEPEKQTPEKQTPEEPEPKEKPEIKKQPTAKKPEQKKLSSLRLPEKYDILEKLGYRLTGLDKRFNMQTPEGRSAIAIALTLGGTEVYGLLKSPKQFFTLLGGYKEDPETGKIIYNKMKGFAQFDIDLHGDKIDTPEKYAKHLANIITGISRMPNSTRSSDFVSDLANKVLAGKIKNKAQFIQWFRQNKFGGSNWQGINDGWGRVSDPDLADPLIKYIRGDSTR